MKELEKLKGAKMLSKKEQKAVKGGNPFLCENGGQICPYPAKCIDRVCVFP